MFNEFFFTRVNMRDVRANLTELIRRVQEDGQYILIDRHGKRVAVIVSPRDWERIEADLDEEFYGPRDPETGRPKGVAWVKATGWAQERKRLREAARVEREGEVERAEVEAARRRRWWRWVKGVVRV